MNHPLLAAFALAALTEISAAQTALNEVPPAGGDLQTLIERVGEDTASLARWHSIRWSDARWNDMEALANKQMAKLQSVNFDSLSQ